MADEKLIKKLEAKINGDYSQKEAYGRGLDQGFRVAIDIIRQHDATARENRDNNAPKNETSIGYGEKASAGVTGGDGRTEIDLSKGEGSK